MKKIATFLLLLATVVFGQSYRVSNVKTAANSTVFWLAAGEAVWSLPFQSGESSIFVTVLDTAALLDSVGIKAQLWQGLTWSESGRATDSLTFSYVKNLYFRADSMDMTPTINASKTWVATLRTATEPDSTNYIAPLQRLRFNAYADHRVLSSVRFQIKQVMVR